MDEIQTELTIILYNITYVLSNHRKCFCNINFDKGEDDENNKNLVPDKSGG